MLVCVVAGACGDDPVGDVDERPPELAMHWPAADADVEGASPMVIVAFDEAIAAGSVGDGTLEVFGTSPVAVPVARVVSTTTIALAPTAPLAPGAYTVKLAAGVADLAGNARTEPFEWTFTVLDRADHQAPQVVFVDPPDGATGVAVDGSVRVFFDEVIDDATAAITLHDASGTPLAATASSVGTGVVAVPSADLPPGEEVTATAAATIADLGGNLLGAPHVWSFTTAAVTRWEPPVALETIDGSAGGTDLAVGGEHDVVVTWFQDTDDRDDVWSARRAGGGWGASALVETTGPGWSRFAAVGMDDTATATAVWLYRDTVSELRTSRQPAGGAWGAEEVLSQAVLLSASARPQLAVNRTTGAAAVVWPPSNFADGWRVRRYTVAGGWEPVETVDTFTASASVSDPQIALAANGDVVMIWHEYAEFADRPTAAVRTASGWSPAIRLGGPLAISNEPRLSMNAAGQAIVVWNQSQSPWNVWAQTWSAAAGWGTPVAIDQSSDDCDQADVKVSADGSAIASWTEWPDGTPHAHAARWTAATGWQPPALVDDHPQGTRYPALAVGDDGAAVLAWHRQVTGQPNSIWAARYTPAGGWRVAEPVSTAAGIVTQGSLIAAIGRDGVATLAWAAYADGQASIFSSQLR